MSIPLNAIIGLIIGAIVGTIVDIIIYCIARKLIKIGGGVGRVSYINCKVRENNGHFKTYK